MGKPDYSIYMIRALLEGYSELEQGKIPFTKFAEYGVRIEKSSSSLVHLASILKADIDRGIRFALKPTEKLILITWLAHGVTIEQCSYWIGCDTVETKHIELKAVKKIYQFLNYGSKNKV